MHVPMHVVGWRGDLRIHVDLPVGLACDIDPAEVTTVILGVSPSQEQLTARLSGGVSGKKNQKQTHEHQRQGKNNPLHVPLEYMLRCLGVKNGISSIGDRKITLCCNMSR